MSDAPNLEWSQDRGYTVWDDETLNAYVRRDDDKDSSTRDDHLCWIWVVERRAPEGSRAFPVEVATGRSASRRLAMRMAEIALHLERTTSLEWELLESLSKRFPDVAETMLMSHIRHTITSIQAVTQ